VVSIPMAVPGLSAVSAAVTVCVTGAAVQIWSGATFAIRFLFSGISENE